MENDITNTRKKSIIIEGLISAGKTTLARELGRALGPTTLTLVEPDEKGESASTNNPYLADYYSDPSRWSLTMQVHMLALRFRMQKHAQWHVMQGYGHAVCDRSYQGDTSFARLQLRDGLMSEREFETYSQLYHAMTASVLLPTVCVRVLVSPDVALERINKRMQKETGRMCESSVSLDYLKGLDREIDHMVAVLSRQGVMVFDLPWDDDRSSAALRRSTVEALARRIENYSPPDQFLDLHRRTA